MVRLNDLIGKKLILTMLDSERSHYEVVLHGVEQGGGVWIENRDLAEMFGPVISRKTALKKKPVFFIPFSRMRFLVSSSVELDETSLGAE